MRLLSLIGRMIWPGTLWRRNTVSCAAGPWVYPTPDIPLKIPPGNYLYEDDTGRIYADEGWMVRGEHNRYGSVVRYAEIHVEATP